MRGCSIATTETIHGHERGLRCGAQVTLPLLTDDDVPWCDRHDGMDNDGPLAGVK